MTITTDETGAPPPMIHSFIWVRLLTIGLGLTLGGLFVVLGLMAQGRSIPGIAAYLSGGAVAFGLFFFAWAVWMRQRYPDRRSWRL